MSRPTEFFKDDELVYWDISIYDADGTALDADANPTVEFRVHGNDTLKTGGVTITKPAGTTGLYRVAHNLASDSDLSIGASVRYQETATIAGVDYVNRWSTIIRAEPAYKTTQDDMEDVVGDINVATTAIEGKTSQLTFTVANQVDANALTGGTSAADIYTYFTTGTNENAFKADVTTLESGGVVYDYVEQTWESVAEDPEGNLYEPIANKVWDTSIAAHQTAGSTGKALQDASVETQNAYVLPISTSDPCAPRGTALTAFINGAATFVLEFKDASGAIVDPTLEALYFVVEDGSTGTDMVVIPDGSLTKTTKNISVTVPASDNTPIGSYRWAVRTETNEKVLGYGVYSIQYAAQDDSP